MSWTRQEVSILIEEYQKYPCLYQVKDKQYKNKHARMRALVSIKNALTPMKEDVEIPEIKSKFNNLKTNVLQEYRKVQKSKSSGSGTDELYEPTLWYYRAMLFVLDHTVPRKALDSLSEDIFDELRDENVSQTYTVMNDGELFEEEIELEQGENIENIRPNISSSDSERPQSSSTILSNAQVTPTFQNNETSGPRRGKKRNIDEESRYLMETANAMKNISSYIGQEKEKKEEEKDESEIFGNFVASKMRQISDESIKLETEQKICINKAYITACICLSKNRLRIVTGILTGHYRLRGHLSKLRVVDDSECRFCEEEDETSIHILTECAVLQNPRALYLVGGYQMEKRERFT
ncbi:unnamed protein product [Psylliodes chrysocephalus]|uniref:MADF domain-containing protein n=1 Tax=Psylliodes chrysocephalus TaxID=3402493 RepID=A0A9P0D003_9CUCU|nr:unnamed protein product [Psylliodes chrysocephala]